jgi:predicted transcriptional regulator
LTEEKKKGYGEAALELHRNVRKAVDDVTRNSDVSCVSVSAIEKEVGKDPRTVKFHLKLLEEAGYGKLSNDGKMFCPTEKKPK